MYGVTGSFDKKSVKLNQDYGISDGSSLFYGKQESVLNKPDHSTRVVNNTNTYDYPSPYTNPILNYGIGPQATNVTQEFISAPNKRAFQEKPVLREPTKDNPFMNPMPLDYDMPPVFGDYFHYEKSTYPSDNDKQIRNMVNNNFDKSLIQDADSLFWNRINSQRQFVSVPVGSVPNNQGEFSQWLWGVPGNCKAASIWVNYGVKYTDESLLCDGFNAAEPTNKGLLNGNLMSSVYQGD